MSNATPGSTGRVLRRLTTYGFVTLGALASVFPLYYMVVGSLQLRADSAFSGLIPKAGNLGLQNYRDVNRAISLLPSLANSAIFTLGTVVLTIVVGLPAGYALARLRFPGKPAVAGMLILVLVLPFQVMMIPLYILVVRDYGLADNYLGMILPFAVNATAVLIFRQFFVSLPDELFDAAHIDGAGEVRTLLLVAAPLTKPAILTASVITFIGPWNEFLWPFLITKKHAMQPLAVSLGEYVSTNAATAANPYGVILAGACVLAVPVIVLFLVAQRHFTSAALGSGVKE
ncbi:multiple sugar transport system permease protein [Catenulispora sp. GAS73]|uniref:carbohydrate ABC transporter permease n=1 Tax=Catenulispora sp. GAS73 TaxID=3156269 RepID=UPI003517D1B5